MLTRRKWLTSVLLGAGCYGLRTLATGLPASFFVRPRRALAGSMTPSCIAQDKAQFIIFNTSGTGDPINASVPGTYEDPNIVHSPDPAMAQTKLTIAGQTFSAAAP